MLGLGQSLTSGVSLDSVNFAFVFTVKTDNSGDSDDDQFSLPITSASTSNTNAFTRPLINVDWGDGNTDEDIGQNSDVTEDTSVRTFSRATHTYDTAGTYTITITEGTSYSGSSWDTNDYPAFQRWDFGGGLDRLKMLEITNWGIAPAGSPIFYGCSNMTVSATDKAKLSFHPDGRDYSSTMSGSINFFMRNCSAVTTIGDWNFEKCTSMRGGFWGASSFNQDITYWYLGKNSSDGSVHTRFTGTVAAQRLFFQASSYKGAGLWNQNCSQSSGSNGLLQIMASTDLTTANYDLLLIAWAAGPTQLSTGSPSFAAQFTPGGAAEAGRDALIAGNWSGITDEGSL